MRNNASPSVVFSKGKIKNGIEGIPSIDHFHIHSDYAPPFFCPR